MNVTPISVRYDKTKDDYVLFEGGEEVTLGDLESKEGLKGVGKWKGRNGNIDQTNTEAVDETRNVEDEDEENEGEEEEEDTDQTKKKTKNVEG